MRLADRLTGPFILTISGGILILVAGLERIALYLNESIVTVASYGVLPVGFVLELCGSIVLLCGIMLFARPDLHQVWGALTVTASSYSIFSFTGISTPTVSVGVLISLIGGVLAIVLKPELKSREAPQISATGSVS